MSRGVMTSAIAVRCACAMHPCNAPPPTPPPLRSPKRTQAGVDHVHADCGPGSRFGSRDPGAGGPPIELGSCRLHVGGHFSRSAAGSARHRASSSTPARALAAQALLLLLLGGPARGLPTASGPLLPASPSACSHQTPPFPLRHSAQLFLFVMTRPYCCCLPACTCLLFAAPYTSPPPPALHAALAIPAVGRPREPICASVPPVCLLLFLKPSLLFLPCLHTHVPSPSIVVPRA